MYVVVHCAAVTQTAYLLVVVGVEEAHLGVDPHGGGRRGRLRPAPLLRASAAQRRQHRQHRHRAIYSWK